jgi:putative oxidoreductase
MKLTMGVSGVGAFLGMLGFPLPGVFAVILIAVEVVGGLALITGFMTHWAAKLTALDMLVALLVVFAPKGFALGGEGGFVLLLLAASVSLMITGPGKFALDNILLRKMQPGSRPDVTSGL